MAEDAVQTAGVWSRARRAAIPFIPAYVHTDAEVRDWIATTVIPHQDTWVAEVDDIVAMMALRNGWIEQLYVDPAWTGHGIGSAMIRLAKDRYPSVLQLWTFASNVGARRFYERHGFREVERTDGHDNEERAPDIRYRWSASERGG